LLVRLFIHILSGLSGLGMPGEGADSSKGFQCGHVVAVRSTELLVYIAAKSLGSSAARLLRGWIQASVDIEVVWFSARCLWMFSILRQSVDAGSAFWWFVKNIDTVARFAVSRLPDASYGARTPRLLLWEGSCLLIWMQKKLCKIYIG